MIALVEEEQREAKCIIKVNEGDRFYLGIDQVKRRVVVHIAASPTRTNFLRRWALLMTEVAKLNIGKDAPIDLVYDYTEARPVPPNLKIILFTKALRAGMVFPNLQTWRVVPGDPSENAFLQKFSREMSSSWLPLRKNEKVFQTVEEAEGYLDEFRTQEPKNYCRESQEEVDADEEEQKQVCLCDQVGQDGLSQVERQDREISDRCTAQD